MKKNIENGLTFYDIDIIYEFAKEKYGIDEWEPSKIAALFFAIGVFHGKGCADDKTESIL